MKELSRDELLLVFGGKNCFSKLFDVVGGALFGGVIEGFLGFCVGGPPGMIIGFGHGLYEGAAVTVIYEGAMGLTETLHPELE